MGLQDNYKVGDKAVMTDFTEVSYSKQWVDSRRGKEAEVVTVFKKTFNAGDLDKDSKPIWRGLYGTLPTYDLWGITIRYADEKHVYIVSNLGYKKVSE
jgi:hypothetical protein